jgi:adenine phosphoribosyltransferase
MTDRLSLCWFDSPMGKLQSQILAPLTDSSRLSEAVLTRIRKWPGADGWDLSHVFSSPLLLSSVIEALAKAFEESKVSKVAGIEPGGVFLAGALALRLNAGLVIFRSQGSTPWGVIQEKVSGGDQGDLVLEAPQDAIARRDRVLIVDDWAASPGKILAAKSLVIRLGGTPVGAACLGASPTLPELGLALSSILTQELS